LKYVLEIQSKFILLTLTVCSTSLVCYRYKDVLLFLVTQMHVKEENLYFIFTDVTELFSVYLKIILFFSFQITLWYLLYHLFSFLSTAFYFQEYKLTSFLFYSGTLFWFLSIFFSSFVVIPFGWNFFLSFQLQQSFYFEARISEYLKFYNNTYFVCLIYCQFLTVFFVFLTDINKNYLYVKKYRKFYYYLFLIISTLITPPDMISQVLTTISLTLVYEIILLFLFFTSKL